MVGVVLGKAFPYPQRVQVWCFARGSRRTEPGYGASRAYKTAQRLQLQHSGSMHPPPRLPLFASGATSAGSRSSGQRQQGRAGQLQGRSRERPQVLDVQAKLCRGSRWALESRLMLSPLPMVVTAQKPQTFPRAGGFAFGSRQSVPQSYPTAAAM